MNNKNIYILIVTHNRPNRLSSIALPSIARQTYQPTGVVLIDDSTETNARKRNLSAFRSLFVDDGEHVYLINDHLPGAGGAWNKGLNWVINKDPDAWIAILDDDDEWLDNHLETCKDYMLGFDIVLSGISVIKNGKNLNTPLPKKIHYKDFYCGNPGWQGSNTFIKASILKSVEGFDENLLCTHDRDIAVRILHQLKPKCAFTGKVTVNYFLDTNRKALTTSKYIKWTGLLQFYKKHFGNMDRKIRNCYIKRAKELFDMDPKLFELLNISDENSGFKRNPIVGNSIIKKGIVKRIMGIRIKIGQWRTNKHVTRLLGTKYKRSKDLIEIDLTYKCNLKCRGCNRSCQQAPDEMEISLEEIIKFVSESIKRREEWKRIRILGGEPTLYSNFDELLYILANYKIHYPRTRIEIVTNGYGRSVQRKLLHIPPFFRIEDGEKKSEVQDGFYQFNMAPSDHHLFDNSDFTNGCSNIQQCGFGLTPLGYYPCAILGGIDRIAGWNIGRKELPEPDDDMTDLLEKGCPLCGRFKQRVFIPRDVEISGSPEQMSKSWEALYKQWKERCE